MSENEWKRRFPNEDVIPFDQKKFKKIKINNRMIKIDLSIADDISWLNDNGYATRGCHSGVPEDHIINTLSKFNTYTWIRFLNISNEKRDYIENNENIKNIITSIRYRKKNNYFAIYFKTLNLFKKFMNILKNKEEKSNEE